MLQIHPVPAFSDNYIWLLRCTAVDVCASASEHCAADLDSGDEVFAMVRAWKDGFRG